METDIVRDGKHKDYSPSLYAALGFGCKFGDGVRRNQAFVQDVQVVMKWDCPEDERINLPKSIVVQLLSLTDRVKNHYLMVCHRVGPLGLFLALQECHRKRPSSVVIRDRRVQVKGKIPKVPLLTCIESQLCT